MTRYRIGYGKPPKATRFQRGHSGNPKGRPKGRRNLATDLTAELNQQILVQQDGGPRRVTKQRALIHTLLLQALHGDIRATAALLSLYHRIVTEPPDESEQDIHENELQILRRFIPRLLKSIQKI